MKLFKWAVLAAALAITGGVLFARQSGPDLASLAPNTPCTLSQALSGSIVPILIKRQSLPETYHASLLTTESTSTFDSMRIFVQAQGESNNQYADIIDKLKAYTGGQILVIDGVRFYITYRTDFLTKDGLRLQLLQCDSVRSITPYPDSPKTSGIDGSTIPTTPDPRAVALGRMKQVALATIMYTGDYDDVYPNGQSTDEVIPKLMPYTKNKEVFQSPQKGGAFHFNVHLSGQLSTTIKQPAEIPIWKEDLPLPSDPFAVAFADGHAKTMDGSEHPQIEKKWKGWKNDSCDLRVNWRMREEQKHNN